MGHLGDGHDGGGGSMDLSALLPTLTLLSARGGAAGGGDSQWIPLMLAVLLPLLLRSMLPKVQAWAQGLKLHNHTTRTISHTRDNSCWWHDEENDDEAFNAIIQRAILKYINTKLPDVAKSWNASDIQARKEDKFLEDSSISCSSSDGGSSCGDNGSGTNSYSHYSYLCAPPDGTWVDLKNGIELERSVCNRNTEGSGSRSSRVTVVNFTLRSTSRGVGPKQLNAFIDKCVDLYNEELRSKIDSSRYFFTPIISAAASSDDKSKSGMLYKKYKLSESRSFASFFHPEKEQILGLVDQFAAKTGKFAIPGYPLKLGFLLHGPPGTGKTSFIKALAQYTKRHVVNIPLNKIKTNQELMNIMFDQSIMISGSEDGSSASLPFGKVVFVMEDVDAASGVVHRREGDAPAAAPPAAQAAAMEAMAMAAAVAAAAANTSKSDSPESSVEDGEVGDAAGNKSMSRSSRSTTDCSPSQCSSMPPGAGLSEGEIRPLNWKDLLKDSAASENDKLNLASLLNVLDGVIDTPERIVVMTTNHPEKLDPALIRPGRINRKIYLGNVKLQQAVHMIRHWFNGGRPLDAQMEKRLASIFIDDFISPAQLESMCAEYDGVEDMISELAAKMHGSCSQPLTGFGSYASVSKGC